MYESTHTVSTHAGGIGSEVIRLADLAIYRVDMAGWVQLLGLLQPVRSGGFVMQQATGESLHSHSLPWWLLDMCPQGFLGRAYASRYAQALGLPVQLAEWQDHHALRALMVHGHDVVGNLLLGEQARSEFLAMMLPEPLALERKGNAYVRLAQEAASGELPGSSAGGEQPKFTSWVQTAEGPCHVLVKFTLPEVNPVTERWRDLLLAEHHALQALRSAGVAAARTWVVDHDGQRFLEVERFDRVGLRGRRGVLSLASLEAEFVGDASAPWPTLAARLAQGKHILPEAAQTAALLYAFGKLIGNTDMHHGNLSFLSEQGRPYALAPAYDMLPMGFAPRASGSLPSALPEPQLLARIEHKVWAQAFQLATGFLARLAAETRFSSAFQACLLSLRQHIGRAGEQVARLV